MTLQQLYDPVWLEAQAKDCRAAMRIAALECARYRKRRWWKKAARYQGHAVRWREAARIWRGETKHYSQSRSLHVHAIERAQANLVKRLTAKLLNEEPTDCSV